RVYEHASTCKKLAKSHPEQFAKVIKTQSNTSLGATVTSTENTEISESQGSASSKPSKKKQKLDVPDITSWARAGGKQKKAAEKAKLQTTVDHLIVRLICSRGLVPELINSWEWKEMMRTLNPNYNPTPSDKFVDSYIPKEACFVRQEQFKLLQQSENISISFDGNNTRCDSIYFVHATTPERESYFIGGHIGTVDRHTTQWVTERVKEIGQDRIANVVSDSTSVTKGSRKEITDDIQTILNFSDCCLHLQLTLKDIIRLPTFKNVGIIHSAQVVMLTHLYYMLSHLKHILSYFGHATRTRALLRTNALDEVKVYALQKLGNTRFGTHYSGTKSVYQCLPNIRELVVSKEIKFKNKSAQSLFASRSLDYAVFELDLGRFVAITEPLARSTWALESSHANAADVYVFWLACAAQYRELFAKGEDQTGISMELANEVIDIFNDHFDEFFMANEVYFTAFALDPRTCCILHNHVLDQAYSPSGYPLSDMLLIPETANPSITVPRPGADLSIPHPRSYDRVREYLKTILRPMTEKAEENPAAYIPDVLRRRDEADTVEAFRGQLKAFWMGYYPFNEPVKNGNTLSWWKDLLNHPQADVLAMLAVKIFSALANSMPDERTGSKFTRMNSALRGNQRAQTVIDMVQIGQWYDRFTKVAHCFPIAYVFLLDHSFSAR
ncbi:ribonuclease H-like domain-containing protein, partial [Amylostereum chailletii]